MPMRSYFEVILEHLYHGHHAKLLQEEMVAITQRRFLIIGTGYMRRIEIKK